MSEINPPLTRAQREAVYSLWKRLPPARKGNRWRKRQEAPPPYREFRKKFRHSHVLGCVIGPFCGMTVGIEPDGHTHS